MAAADDFFALDEDGEFTVAPFDEFHLEARIAPQTRRHTGGVDAGDSIPAAANGDAHQMRSPIAVAAHVTRTMKSAPPTDIAVRARRE